MSRPAWYLLSYDVREPRRLQRLHRHLSKRGIPMQESVFFIRARHREIDHLRSEVDELIHRREDDVRIYPIGHPSAVWLHGFNAFAADPESAEAPPVRLLERLKNFLGVDHG